MGELFRVDAKAEGSDVVVLGWWATGPVPDPSKARWFSHRLSRVEAPWAFESGYPFRVIASLELLAVLLGVILLVPCGAGSGEASGRIELSVGTDNQSNEGLIRKHG